MSETSKSHKEINGDSTMNAKRHDYLENTVSWNIFRGNSMKKKKPFKKFFKNFITKFNLKKY